MSSDIDKICSAAPRVALARLPSPVAPLPALSAHLQVPVWVKNDGVNSLEYAGNKVRKLEFLLAEAQAGNARQVITLGAAGSNHAVATSTYARQLGLRCTVCMTHQPVAPVVTANLRRHARLETQLKIFDRYPEAYAHARHLADATDSYLIPLGGSSPLASLGFVQAAAELATQIDNNDMPMPARLYVACGTMGTAVGLVIGFAMLKLPIQVVAVRVTAPAVASPVLFQKLYAESTRYLRALDDSVHLPATPGNARLLFCEDYYGAGYGVPTPNALSAIEAARADHLVLDPTYTGKAMSALIAHARSGQLAAQTTLFWNTLNAQPPPPDALTTTIANTDLYDEAFARYFQT